MNPIGLLVVAAGIFSIVGAALDWDWFINSRKAQFWVAILGRTGTRIFYGILGLAISIFGILWTLGLLNNAA